METSSFRLYLYGPARLSFAQGSHYYIPCCRSLHDGLVQLLLFCSPSVLVFHILSVNFGYSLRSALLVPLSPMENETKDDQLVGFFSGRKRRIKTVKCPNRVENQSKHIQRSLKFVYEFNLQYLVHLFPLGLFHVPLLRRRILFFSEESGINNESK